MSRSLLKRLVILRHQKCYEHILSRPVSVSSRKDNINNNILSNPEKIDIPRVSIPEFIFGKLETYDEFVAFECPLTHIKYTYAEVRKYSRNLSKILRTKLGLNKGDVVLIYLPNCPQFPIATLGCLEAGLIASTVNSLYTAGEVLRQLKDSSSKIIITTCNLYATVTKAVSELPRKIPIICIKTKPEQLLPQGTIDFYELIKTTLDISDLEPPHFNDAAILPYSSGTTGLPKGVKLTHGNIVANLTQISHPSVNFLECANGNFQEVSPGVLPMFHIYGFTICTMKLLTQGAKVVTMPRFQPETFIDVLKNYPISIIFAAPPLILFLTHHPDVKIEYFKKLKNIMSGAAPLGITDEEKFKEKAGKEVSIFQGYGLTETSPVVSLATPSLLQQFPNDCKGSIGRVLLNTEIKFIKLGDNGGTALAPHEEGELLVRGPQVMEGYHNNPQATKDTFLGDWFRTGDLGHYNEHGFMFITDRVKELIKVRGFQVAPAELEEILRSHPKVADAAVVGIPDEINGEVPRAYIQTKGNVDTRQIYQFVADKVAKYKRLEGGIEVIKDIPKNASGKILRRELKNRYLSKQNT
ncbi:uncharacterized protein pdgy [Euwallacea fornicatus]|uniref:uncharacterized protein pdgy n=1 Tax=Euwallacea fornicatus TaxID=995702 RepID=UPI003390178F